MAEVLRITATQPRRSVNGTTRRPSRRPLPDHSTIGLRDMALNTSTGSWPAKPRSTSRAWCETRPTSNIRIPRAGHNYYHLSEDLADDAVNYLRRHKAFEPDKPFFMYWASGAAHGPHQVPKEWADKYKGQFDDGWDKYRERTFQRAKEKGWIPADAVNTPRPANLASWDSIPEEQKPFHAASWRSMPGFANTWITRSGGSWTKWTDLATATTRWSATSGVTTAPRRKVRTVPSAS